MASVSTYLNFMGRTEAAFAFYASVFGTEPSAPIMRMGDMPAMPGAPELSDADQQLVMNVQLPILGGHVLMGTDMMESMGHELHAGNNVSINLQPDTKDETHRLFAALADGGSDVMGPMEMPWGLFGTCVDRFGTRWMVNCDEGVASA
jgi:PhnB protein